MENFSRSWRSPAMLLLSRGRSMASQMEDIPFLESTVIRARLPMPSSQATVARRWRQKEGVGNAARPRRPIFRGFPSSNLDIQSISVHLRRRECSVEREEEASELNSMAAPVAPLPSDFQISGQRGAFSMAQTAAWKIRIPLGPTRRIVNGHLRRARGGLRGPPGWELETTSHGARGASDNPLRGALTPPLGYSGTWRSPHGLLATHSTHSRLPSRAIKASFPDTSGPTLPPFLRCRSPPHASLTLPLPFPPFPLPAPGILPGSPSSHASSAPRSPHSHSG